MRDLNQARWALFDADWYARAYKDSLQGLAPSELEGFYHATGAALHHSPNAFFDEAWYLATYPDVAEAVSSGGFASGFSHYGLAGHQDRSPHWLFSESLYMAQYDDLTTGAMALGSYVNGYDHYLRHGDAEYRSGHWLFDPQMHRTATIGIATTGVSSGEFQRFLLGNREAGSTDRLSWYFDPIWYLATYADAYEQIAEGIYTCALEHYLRNPTPVLFDPNAHFSEEFYREAHHDVHALLDGGQIRNCFEHFLRYGAAERRQPHPSVDLANYFRRVAVQTRIDQGFYRDPFCDYEANFALPSSQFGREDPQAEQGRSFFAAEAANLLCALIRHPLDFTYLTAAISVIIVAHNNFALTMATLASLRANYGGPIQVILVDSASHDDISRIEQFVLGLQVMRFGHNIGYVLGCNAALQLVQADTTLYLNNDAQLAPGALPNAVARLWSGPNIGAVGGKIIHPHGKLQEAGSIIWRDGWCTGYLRGRDPDIPEANFVREVDFCSAAFLLCRSDVLRQLNGFDPEYSPAYFEEADLAIRMQRAGYITVYDPSVLIRHYERATGAGELVNRLMKRNQPIFRRKNGEFLRHQFFNNPALATRARASNRAQKRILFIEDRLPFRHLGSGFVRSNDILHALVALGYHVTVFPVFKTVETTATVYKAFPDSVEVINDRELGDFEAFVAERSGYYHAIWIARTHNAERLAQSLSRLAGHLPVDRVLLDTEALATIRNLERERVQSEEGLNRTDSPQRLNELIKQELTCAFVSQCVLAVNPLEARLIEGAGFGNVRVLGHALSPSLSPPGWSARRGILFFGAIPNGDSPNFDALRWFSSQVLPLLHKRLPLDVAFAVAGRFDQRLDFSPLRRNPRVELIGAVDDLDALYRQYRILVAPTRFAAGIPYKVHEAAAHGVPVVASDLLIGQLGWTAGRDIARGDLHDPQQFADAVIGLYDNEERWTAMQANGLARIRAEHDPVAYNATIGSILADLLAGASG